MCKLRHTWADMTEDFAPWFQAVSWPDGSFTSGWPTYDKAKLLCQGVTLEGKTAFDVGCMAGMAALAMEQAGAKVIGSDIEERCRLQFEQVRRAFKMSATYKHCSVYDLPQTLGQADVVLMMGVYYHLRHPLLGLEQAWAATREVLLIEGEVGPGGWQAPMVASYWPEEYKGDESNWWVPTLQCLEAWCRGLPGVQKLEMIWPFGLDSRAGVRVWKVEQ